MKILLMSLLLVITSSLVAKENASLSQFVGEEVSDGVTRHYYQGIAAHRRGEVANIPVNAMCITRDHKGRITWLITDARHKSLSVILGEKVRAGIEFDLVYQGATSLGLSKVKDGRLYLAYNDPRNGRPLSTSKAGRLVVLKPINQEQYQKLLEQLRFVQPNPTTVYRN
jgi:hypothetical protein